MSVSAPSEAVDARPWLRLGVDPHAPRFAYSAARLCGAVAASIAACVLIGWAAGSGILQGATVGAPRFGPVPAVIAALTAASLLASSFASRPAGRWLAHVFGATAAIVAGAALIDGLIAHGPANHAAYLPAPSRSNAVSGPMPLPMIVLFAMAVCSVLSTTSPLRAAGWIGQAIGLAGMVASFYLLTASAIGGTDPLGWLSLTDAGPLAAAALAALFVGSGPAWPGRSLRWRFAAIGLVVVAPLTAVMIHQASIERDRALHAAQLQVGTLAALAAETQADAIDQAKTLLTFLSKSPELRKGATPECDAYLRESSKMLPFIASMRLSDVSGLGLCSDIDVVRTYKIEDRAYFIDTIATKGFVVSDMIIARLNGLAFIIANYPVLDTRGAVTGVLTMAISPDVFGKLTSPRLRDEGLSLALIDRNGVLIAHNPPLPDLVGRSLKGQAIAAGAMALPRDAVAMSDLTGADKLVAFAPMPALNAILAVGIDRASIIGPIDRALRDRMALIMLIVTFGVVTGLAGSEFFVFRPLRLLATTAKRQVGGQVDHHAFDLGGTGEVAEVNVAIAAMVATIGEREHRLSEAEALFRGLFESSTDYLSVFRLVDDGSFVVETCNRAATARLGANAVGRRIEEVIPGQRGLRALADLRRAVAVGETLRVEDRAQEPGAHGHFDIHLTPLRNNAGRIDRVFVGSRDVSHLRRAESDAQEANRMLLMAETLAHVGHWQIELPSGNLVWSDEMFRIYGLERQQNPPTLGQVIACSHPDDRQAVVDNLKDAIEHGTDWVHHLRLITEGGETRYVMTRGICERHRDGKVSVVFGVTSDVTDARRAEIARAAAANLLHVTLDTMDQGLMLVDASDRIRIANRRSLDLLELPAELMADEPSTSDVIAFQRARGEFDGLSGEVTRRLQPLAVGEQFYIYERERPNGTILEIRTVPLPEGGSVRTYTDITARRRIEQAVAESQALYKLLAETTSDVITRMDLDFVRDYVSPACDALLGYSPEALTGGKPVEIMHPDDARMVYRATQPLVTGERERGNVMYRARHREGRWIWVEANITLVRDDAGAPQGLVSSLRDVTARKLAEDRVAESEARFRLLAENASDVIMLRETGPRGRRTYVSPSCRAVLGYDMQECLTLDIETLMHADDLPEIMALYARLGPDVPQATSVHRLRHRDGHWIWVEVVFTYMPAPPGGAAQIIGAIRDVTERQRQARHLEAAKLAAEAGARAKSEFLANMTHELRTPLTGILGVHDLLLNATGLNDNERRLLGLARQAGQSLLAIVNDVLDFSKIEGGYLAIEAIPFSVRETIEECRNLATGLVGDKPIALTIEVSADLPARLLGDPARLRQILLNLITNAIKFTDEGQVIVAARWQSAARIATIDVRDTGIGIMPETLPFLFERFKQADASTTRRFGGTGLGLAICKRLVVLMGGDISVETEFGRGSTFRIAVPLQLADAGVSTGPDAVSLSTPSSDVLDILLAEDNGTNQEIIAAVLRRHGHRVSVVDNGAAAVAAISSGERFDVVLMDMQMPVMDGVAAATAIRLFERTDGRQALPIIALTANALREDVQRCIDAGMTMHVAKPIDWTELFGLLGQVRAGSGRSVDDPGTPSVLSVETLDELAEFVGGDRVANLLMSFASDTRRRLAILDASTAGDGELSSQAHSMLSLAGQLGFLELAELCREIQDADELDPGVDRMAELREVASRALNAAELSNYGKVAGTPEREPIGMARRCVDKDLARPLRQA